MKSFTATIKTETGNYDIDYKSNKHSHNWCVMHNTGAVYLSSIQECLDWVESHNKYLLTKFA